ncbi:MAG: hypothetical protein Kow0047_29800 [Anaerolineae bacterium]
MRRVALGLALLSLILIAFASQVGSYLADNDEANGDEVAYLRLAIEVRERWGGPLGLVGALVRGEFTEANRHPLYIAILSSISRRELSAFDRARDLDVWIAAASLAAIYAVIWRHFRLTAAALVTLATAVNRPFLQHVAIVGVEPMLVGLLTVALVEIYVGLRSRRALPLGLCALSLAYLAKASAQLVLPPLALGLVLSSPRRWVRDRRLWWGLLAAVLIASPLFIRNVRLYGSPWYNMNASVFWLDAWDQRYEPEFEEGTYTMARYLRTHSIAQMWDRLRAGTAKNLEFLSEMAGAPLSPKRAGSIRWGIPILLLAAIGMATRGDRAQRAFVGSTFLMAILMFGWYMWVAPSPRFMLPFLPTAYLFAWLGAGWLTRKVWSHRALRQSRVGLPSWIGAPLAKIGVAAMAIAVLIVALVRVAAVTPPAAQEPPAVAELRTWLETTLPPGEDFLAEPTDRFSFAWYAELPGQAVRTPPASSWEELTTFLHDEGISWMVVTPYLYERRRPAFQDIIAYAEDAGFLFLRGVPDWALVKDGGSGRDRFLVLHRDGAPTHPDRLLSPAHADRFQVPIGFEETASYRFGGLVTLRAFELSARDLLPGSPLTVTVAWQREAHTDVSYTVFVHLLDEAETRVWAQRDTVPRDGTYPIPEWLAGEVVVDSYAMPLPTDLPSGRYKVEIGLYDVTTGARVPVVDEAGDPVGDRVILADVLVATPRPLPRIDTRRQP